jgi:hypothetical protein
MCSTPLTKNFARAQLTKMIRIISQWVVNIRKRVNSTRRAKKLTGGFHVIITINNVHMSQLHQCEDRLDPTKINIDYLIN